MGGVICVFLFVIVLQLCKKSYSKRRKSIYPVSQEEKKIDNESDFQRQNWIQKSCDTISKSMKTAHSPLETKYEDINEILQTRARCFSFSELSNVYDRANY